MIKYLTLLALISVLLSCHSDDKNYFHYLIDNDSLLGENYKIKRIKPGFKEFQKAQFKYTVTTYKHSYRLNFDLDTLENGYKDFQIRFWLGHSLAIEHQILVIRRVDKKWDCELYKYFPSNGKQIALENIKPKSSLEDLMYMLYSKGLFDIKNSEEVNGYECGGGGDGITYDIEIATPTKYRLITYCELYPYHKQFAEVKKIKEITELLESEFNFNITD